jgi:hypothetical protein
MSNKMTRKEMDEALSDLLHPNPWDEADRAQDDFDANDKNDLVGIERVTSEEEEET